MPDFTRAVADAFRAAGHLPDHDIVEELAAHAAAAYETARAEGCDAAEAHERVAALMAAWTASAGRLRRRPARPAAAAPPPASASRLAGLLQDITYSVRVLRRQPGAALVAIATMALGIGAATTLFSLAYGVLVRPLPWPDADRLVRITETRKGHEPRVRGTMSNGPYREWASRHSTLDAIGGWLTPQAPTTLVIAGGEPVLVQTAPMTPSMFTVLEARPLLGRLFVDADAPPLSNTMAERPMILSYGLWQERFGGRRDALGRAVRIDGKPATIVGVMPKEFAFPDSDTRAWTPWLPPPVYANGVQSMTIFRVMARLRRGATPEQATAEGTARAHGAPDPGLTAVALFGGNGPAEIRAVPAVEQMTADVRPALLVIAAAVLLLLLTAIANVASLQLARATARRGEFAIRAAIGAGIARLARQLVVESAAIGAAGAVGGIAIALALHRAMPMLLPASFPRLEAVHLDWRVLAFAIVTSAAASLACGLLPAWHVRRVDLTATLSEGNASTTGGTRTPAVRARTLIVAGQLAVSCVLLVGAALLVRSFDALVRADRGYDPTNVLTGRIALPTGDSMEQRTLLLQRIAARLRPMPGVRAVAYGNALPLLTAGGFRGLKFRPPIDPSTEVEANLILRGVSPGYVAALGLRLIEGRTFEPLDSINSANVIMVNRTFADKYLGAHPLGTSVPNLGMCRGDDDRWTVVGVIDDMRQESVAEAPQAEIYLPLAQVGCTGALTQAVFAVRTAGDPQPYADALRQAVRAEAPAIAVDSVMTMDERLTRALANPRLYAVVLGGFAIFAVAIAAVGIFGALSYIVTLRTREIGVRSALGAPPATIVRLLARQIGIVTIAGIAAGLSFAFVFSRWLVTVLYAIRPHDPASFGVVAATLVVVVILAAVVPLRRAARIDPVTVLR